MQPGVYYYYPVTSIGKHTHYTVRDYDTRHTRASTALSAAVALMSRAVCISITHGGGWFVSWIQLKSGETGGYDKF